MALRQDPRLMSLFALFLRSAGNLNKTKSAESSDAINTPWRGLLGCYAPQHFLNFFPLRQGQGSLRPTLGPSGVGAAFAGSWTAAAAGLVFWSGARPPPMGGSPFDMVPTGLRKTFRCIVWRRAIWRGEETGRVMVPLYPGGNQGRPPAWALDSKLPVDQLCLEDLGSAP